MNDDLIKRLRDEVAQHEPRCLLLSPETVIMLLDEIERLRAELETERIRLAACGVVADANTPESAAKHRRMHPDYYSASCESVVRAVDREMQLRAENAALAADARRYRWLRGDSCPDHSIRWTQWDIRCWVAPFWSDDLRREGLDKSIDVAMAAEIGRMVQHE